MLQEEEERLETQQFSLHGGMAAVQRFQGVDEGIAVSRDDRQASVGKGAMSGTESIDQALIAHPILKDVRFNQSFPLVIDTKKMFLEFEECFDNSLRESPMIGIDHHFAELVEQPVWPSRGKGRRYVPSKLPAIEKDIDDGLAFGKYRLSKGISVGATAHCVQKGEGRRVKWDLKEVNKNLKLQDFPILAVKDLMRSERTGTWMVTLDLLKALKQIPIEEDSQKIFNLRSPAYDVMPKVMMMGDANAPGKLNQEVQALFGKVPGLLTYLDDLSISADGPKALLDWVG